MSDTHGLVGKFARAARKRACRLSCRMGATPVVERPVFIVGCGRSGTTILGETLAVHPEVTYLNEHRQLWADAYPVTDVWSASARRRRGRLELTRSDHAPERDRRLIANFYCETVVAGRPRLVEKLPINSFRLSFIDAIFPDALYVHIRRNGLEVARSIDHMPVESEWYGHDDVKWKLLAQYAESREQYRELPVLCDTTWKRGLLEWRMSVEAATASLDGLPGDRSLTVKYEELLDAPVDAIQRIEEFVGLVPSERMHSFAEANLKRRSPVIEVTSLSDEEERLAGELMRRLGYLRA
jgi:hypothetical protein